MKFKYSFQKVLDLKENQTSQAEWMLSEAVNIMESHTKTLTQLENEKQVAQENVNAVMSKCTTIQHLLFIQDQIDMLDHMIILEKQKIEQSKVVVLERKRNLEECMKQEDMWLKSKDKALETFKSTLRKKEQEELDDMVSARFQRMTS